MPNMMSAQPNIPSQRNYGVVEKEIEVEQLIKNLSVALQALQELYITASINGKLRPLAREVADLKDRVFAFRATVQKIFKDIEFIDDIVTPGPTSKERVFSSERFDTQSKEKLQNGQKNGGNVSQKAKPEPHVRRHGGHSPVGSKHTRYPAPSDR